MLGLLELMEVTRKCAEKGHDMQPYKNFTGDELAKVYPYRSAYKCTKCGYMKYQEEKIEEI